MAPKQYRLLIGAVSLVKGHVRGIGPAMSAACEHLQPVLEASSWFPEAPFGTVSLILRLGLEDGGTTELSAVHRAYRELPVARVVSLRRLRSLPGRGQALRDAIISEATRALNDVASHYSLPQLRIPVVHGGQ